VNVPPETVIRAVARTNAAPGRAEKQDTIAGLLSDVVRGFRRQHVDLAAGEPFPFPVCGLSMAAVREISERRLVRGLAALQRAFRRAQEQDTADHTGSLPPC
jgi:hypothetical protein